MGPPGNDGIHGEDGAPANNLFAIIAMAFGAISLALSVFVFLTNRKKGNAPTYGGPPPGANPYGGPQSGYQDPWGSEPEPEIRTAPAAPATPAPSPTPAAVEPEASSEVSTAEVKDDPPAANPYDVARGNS